MRIDNLRNIDIDIIEFMSYQFTQNLIQYLQKSNSIYISVSIDT